MTDRPDSSRRRALAQIGAAGSLATLAPWAAAQAKPITIGVIYVGPPRASCSRLVHAAVYQALLRKSYATPMLPVTAPKTPGRGPPAGCAA